MKIETFGEIAAKTACPGKFFLIFNVFFSKRHRTFLMILSVLGQFLEFAESDGLHIAYFNNTKGP